MSQVSLDSHMNELFVSSLHVIMMIILQSIVHLNLIEDKTVPSFFYI